MMVFLSIRFALLRLPPRALLTAVSAASSAARPGARCAQVCRPRAVQLRSVEHDWAHVALIFICAEMA